MKESKPMKHMKIFNAMNVYQDCTTSINELGDNDWRLGYLKE